MAKIVIPEGLQGKSLFKYLVDNKKSLVDQKKSAWEEGYFAHKRCDPVSGPPSYYRVKNDKTAKTAIGDIPPDATSVLVKVVGNAAWWCDTQMDVLVPDCWKKSIQERQGMMPHIHDHKFMIEAEVGDVRKVYSQDVSLVDLGLSKAGTTQCLIWETDIIKEYNPKIFDRYKRGKINQHSISLNYVRIELAINDEDYEKEIDFWNKYAPNVINQDVINDRGYFWVIQEIKVIENSCVLLGANELTPTLSVSEKFDTGQAPSIDTHVPPSPDNAFDFMKAFRETTFIKN